MSKLPRPEGHHTITPGFSVRRAGDVLAFLERAFDGKVVDRYEGPGGALMHCEIKLGDSVVMFGDTPPAEEPRPASLSYYVDDGAAVDAAFRRALDAGASAISEPTDQPWGYRSACVRDSGGNRWTICAVVEQLTREQILDRMKDMMPS